MWVVSGPFDGVQDGAKEKLLKPGKTYTVGREKSAGGQSQDGRINIDSKSISHEHIDLIIGKYEIDDVCIMETVVVVNADSRIKKDRMRDIALESSKLGITISKSWMDSATHFATQSINLSRRPLHCLMLGISLVDTKWLEEVFRRGSRLPIDSGPDDQGVVALESHFILPDERDFRPQLQASEDEDEDVTEWPVELWDANSDRKLIWKGLQFHFFCDDSPPTEWTDQAQLGGATFKSHNFNPEDPADRISKVEQANMLFQNIRLGASKLGQVPGMKSPVVIVIKPSELVATLGKTVWMVYQEGMRNNGFKYVTPRDVTQAVLRMDVSSIDCGLEMVPLQERATSS
ncbi:hypothetical protein RhiJN_19358 [Ceratobasidium sp. AG-Ba]|nr:hypothetical protein RhiJN_19358 [Ceratobasidium sp. AG-Ba]